jgi:hypothetical protein
MAVIDILPQEDWRQLEGVPDRGGHGIPIDELIVDMIGSGFEIAAIHRDWRSGDEDRYCVVFRVPTQG